METLKFPEGFLWGSATSAYQVEGGIENNDWVASAREGKVPSAGRATDHFNLYEKDFDLAKSLGHNAHRFSIEWARVEPEEGKFNEEAIAHYRKVLQALRVRGLEPFVTLWHFTNPIWFAEKGAFENKKASFYFSRYCEYVVSRLGEYVKFWITVNEPMIYSGEGYWHQHWLPFKKNILKFMNVANNLAMSHNVAYKKIKTLNSSWRVGIAHNVKSYEFNKNLVNHLLAKTTSFLRNHWFLSQIIQAQDFIGVNYYFHRGFGEKAIHDKTDMGWEIYSKGIYNVLKQLKKYKKPIYITENGLADAKDEKRAKFIKDHLRWAHRAMQEGVDLRGYLHWSLLDNFEWAHGFGPRFGLIEVDYQTMERRIRPSAWEYAKICKSNQLEI